MVCCKIFNLNTSYIVAEEDYGVWFTDVDGNRYLEMFLILYEWENVWLKNFREELTVCY